MMLSLVPLDGPVADGLQKAVDEGFSTDLGWYDARLDTRRYSVLRSRDNIGVNIPDWRWHISVAGQDDVPRWRDLVAIAHELRPGVAFVVGVPPRSHWMSVHPHCLHLWETHDENLTAQWMAERQGSTPS
jgi:hypothetical protein